MLSRTIKYTFMTIIVVTTMLLQPLVPLLTMKAAAAPRPGTADVVAAPAQAAACQIKLYLPLIVKSGGGPSATATTLSAAAGPEFEIISPGAGWDISGSLFFAAQPADPAAVTSVAFCAGSTELGTDSTPADGFKVFLDAKSLPPGEIELSALASGPGGQAIETITVNVVSNPPVSGVIGSAGGVLATDIGSIITIPPNAVPDGANISVMEKTQQQVTAETGLDWDAMGVIFLGAQDIQSDSDFARPLGVSSAGFGNRVQPGQAVVNYRLAPDVNGDGVDELTVVNTAAVAPNGDVISDPVPQATIDSIKTTSKAGTASLSTLQAGLSGPSGTLLEIEVGGFNPYSAFGNVALFRSSGDGAEVEVQGIVTVDADDGIGQIFSTIVPPLPQGQATLTLRNKSTGSTTEPIEITIEASPPLTKPAKDTIDETLTSITDVLNQFANLLTQEGLIQEANIFNKAIARGNELQAYIQQISLNPTPAEAQFLEDFAGLLENSGIRDDFSQLMSQDVSKAQTICDAPFREAAKALGRASIVINTALVISIPQAELILQPFSAFLKIASLGLGLVGAQICDPPEPASPCQPAQNNFGSGLTGMGAAPPPGGNGCGVVAGNGADGSKGRANRTIIKLFSDGAWRPFSAMTDPGGYFFLPLIPAGEPFTATAFDTVITVTLTAPPLVTATVVYSMNDGTATNVDYVAMTGTLTFAPGETEQAFSVVLLDDINNELNETVLLSLHSPTNAILGPPSTATLTIEDDDDSQIAFDRPDYMITEADATATATVTLSSPAPTTVAVDYSANEWTASAGRDYEDTSGTLTFSPGQTSLTFIVTITDDTFREPAESALLTLSNPTPASLVIPGSSLTATLTITDGSDTGGCNDPILPTPPGEPDIGSPDGVFMEVYCNSAVVVDLGSNIIDTTTPDPDFDFVYYEEGKPGINPTHITLD